MHKIVMVDVMAQMSEKAKDEVSNNISQAQEKQKKKYEDRHAFHSKIKPGDRVPIINSSRQHRMGPKMTPRYLGPYEVVQNITKGSTAH